MGGQRCILVTGGSRGIGFACCQMLSSLGIATVSLSRTAPTVSVEHSTHIPVDLSDIPATGVALKQVLKEFDISGVICNAGKGDIGSLENFSAQQIQQSVTLNLISPLYVARECLPTLRSCKRSDIIFIGSTSALQGARYGTLYSASKFGLRGTAQALSHEVAAANCHVGIVQPGMARTSFFDNLDFEPGPETTHAITAEDVANAVKTMLLSPDHAVINELIVQPRQHVVQKRKR